jgi:hypothetical protein
MSPENGSMKIHAYTILFVLILLPSFARAEFVITEIMYDPSGADTGREWVEVQNEGAQSQDLSSWRLFVSGVNHKLSSLGTGIIPAGGFAVIADNPEKFKIDFPSFRGLLFDSSFSLKNTGDTAAILDGDLIEADRVSFTSDQGAAGDGDSLHVTDSGLRPGPATPGAGPAAAGTGAENNDSAVGAASSSAVLRTSGSPGFSVDIETPERAMAGADAEFRGTAFGLKGEPLHGERYLWNFGDGTIAEGNPVRHAYMHPGTYAVVLDVSSGEHSVGGVARVPVVASAVSIASVESGENGYVEIENASPYDADVSNWMVSIGGLRFTLPSHTLLLSRSKTAFGRSGGIASQSAADVELLYPNGVLADRFIPPPPSLRVISRKAAVVSSAGAPLSVSAPALSIAPDRAAAGLSNEKIPDDRSTASPADMGSITSVPNSDKASARSTRSFVGLIALIGMASAGVVLFRSRDHTGAVIMNAASDAGKPAI